MFVCILLITTQLVAICTLRRFFASVFKKEIKSITLILYSFSSCYLIRSAYEAYENIRNTRQLKEHELPK